MHLHRFFRVCGSVLLAQFTLPRYVQSTPQNAAACAAYTLAMFGDAKQPQKVSVALFHTTAQREPASYLDGLPDAAIHPSLQGWHDGEELSWCSMGHSWGPCQETWKITNEDGDEQSMSLQMLFQDTLLHEYLVFWAWVQRLLSSNSVSSCSGFHCKLPHL